MIIRLTLFFYSFVCFAFSCYSQEVIDLDTIILYTPVQAQQIQAKQELEKQELANQELKAKEKLEKVKNDSIVGFFSIFKGKPGKAALYSLMIPGGGQAYNKKYIKVGLAIIADGLAIGNAINQTRKFNVLDYQYRGVLAARDAELPFFENIPVTTTNIASLKTIRERRRQYKDYAWFSVGIVHLITVIEAFVDRHLIEFDVDDDLSLKLLPQTNIPNTMGIVGIQYNF